MPAEWRDHSDMAPRPDQYRYVPSQHVDCGDCLHDTTGRSRVRRGLVGSDPHRRPRAAAMSYVQALRNHGRRRVSWSGCVRSYELSTHFHRSYAHRGISAGALLELNRPHGCVHEVQGSGRWLLITRGSIRSGVGSVAYCPTGRLHAVAGPGNIAGCSRHDSRRPTGRTVTRKHRRCATTRVALCARVRWYV